MVFLYWSALNQRISALWKNNEMKLLEKINQHFKIRNLQKQFDAQVQAVQQLIQDGRIQESGEALLEAERMRKEIEEMENLEAPRLDEDNISK